jgi:hypothetical protein
VHLRSCRVFLCFVDRASRYIYVIKTNWTHYLSSVYFVSKPLHVSGVFVAHHQEVYCIYTATGTCFSFQLTLCWPANRQSTEKHSTYQLLYIYSIPPDDGLQIRPKYVEVDWRNKLRINSKSSCFYYIDSCRVFVRGVTICNDLGVVIKHRCHERPKHYQYPLKINSLIACR